MPRPTGMSAFEIDLPAVRAASVVLSAAATAVGESAEVLGDLRLSPEQVGSPDGAVVADAVARYAERASRRLAERGEELRTHAVSVRTACTSYGEIDQACAERLAAVR